MLPMKYALNGGTDAKPTETAIALWEKGKPMDDLISRQMAIDALENTKEVAR